MIQWSASLHKIIFVCSTQAGLSKSFFTNPVREYGVSLSVMISGEMGTVS